MMKVKKCVVGDRVRLGIEEHTFLACYVVLDRRCHFYFCRMSSESVRADLMKLCRRRGGTACARAYKTQKRVT